MIQQRIRRAADRSGASGGSGGFIKELQQQGVDLRAVVTGAVDRLAECAWGLSFPANSESPFLPDLHSNYQGLGLRFFSNLNGSVKQGKPDEVSWLCLVATSRPPDLSPHGACWQKYGYVAVWLEPLPSS